MAWLRTALALVSTWTLVSLVSPEGREPAARIRGLRRLSPDPVSGSYKTETWWDKSEDYTDGDSYTDGDAVAEFGDVENELSHDDEGFHMSYVDDSAQRPHPRAPGSSSPCRTTPAAAANKIADALPPPPTKPTNALTMNPKPTGCNIPPEQRVSCGSPGITTTKCEYMGGCVDPKSSSCFYPMDDCTKDEQFVFAIHADSITVPVDPASLVIPGTNCTPVIVNSEFAIFKFSIKDCGTHAYKIGHTLIYLAEVQTTVKVRNMKFGAITRDDPIRFMFECRYNALHNSGYRQKGPSGKQWVSIGFMVKAPPMNLPVTDAGVTALTADDAVIVQLKMAKDKTYSKYHTHNHQPLKLILGQPVYLEVLLMSKRPGATLKVNYCLAYPRSAKNALVLIYEGCANPLDPQVSILQLTSSTKRRFMVTAFQFMDVKTQRFLDEEIYFMCSTEVCLTTDKDKDCAKSCFDGKMR